MKLTAHVELLELGERYASTTETGEDLDGEAVQGEPAVVHLWPSGRVLGTPAPQGEVSGLELGADAELDHSLATGGVKGISDSEVPFALQVVARISAVSTTICRVVLATQEAEGRVCEF